MAANGSEHDNEHICMNWRLFSNYFQSLFYIFQHYFLCQAQVYYFSFSLLCRADVKMKRKAENKFIIHMYIVHIIFTTSLPLQIRIYGKTQKLLYSTSVNVDKNGYSSIVIIGTVHEIAYKLCEMTNLLRFVHGWGKHVYAKKI